MNAKNSKRGFDRLWLVVTAIYLVLGLFGQVGLIGSGGDATLKEVLTFCMVPVVLWVLWFIGWRAGVWIVRGFKGNP